MSKPRAFTEDEVRQKFLDTVHAYVDYWATVTPARDCKDRLDGLAFSIIVMLDGGNVGMPGFKVIPMPHPSDREYCKQNGENWYPTGCDIGGSLHEHWHQEVRK